MTRVRKVIGIITSLILYFCVLIGSLGVVLFFAVQSSSFQTYIGQKAANWLSDELKTKVAIKKIDFNFFSTLTLNGVYIQDLNKDTLVYLSELNCNIKLINLTKNKLYLNKLELKNGTIKAITYRNDTLPNYQFLVDYFSNPNDTSKSEPFDVKYGKIIFSNVNAIYHNQNDTIKTKAVNFSNIRLKKLSGTIEQLKVQKDSVFIDLHDFTFFESSGFTLTKLNTVCSISPTGIYVDSLFLKTPFTFLNGHYHMKTKRWNDYSDFVNKVKLDLVLKDSSKVSAADIAFFAPELMGNKDSIRISGEIKGKVSSLYGKKINIGFGAFTRYKGDFYLQDVQNINDVFFHFDIKELSTKQTDVESIHVPPFQGNSTLSIPDNLKRFGQLTYKGLLIGKLNEVIAKGKLVSGLGNIETDVSIKNLTEKKHLPEYIGKLKTENFDLGILTGNKNLGLVSMDVEVNGKGFNLEDLSANLKGSVNQLSYNNYNYNNITLTGDFKNKLFNGTFESKDKNADVYFFGSANFANKIPELDFITTINKLDFAKLNLITSDSIAEFSSQVAISLRGDDIDHLSGRINFDNSNFIYKDKRYKLSVFDLYLDQEQDLKNIKLSSTIADFNCSGNFNLTTVGNAVKQVISNYYPTFVSNNEPNKNYTDEFEFNIKIKRIGLINGLFFPELDITTQSLLSGKFSAIKKQLSLDASFGKILYSGKTVNGLGITLRSNTQSGLELTTGATKISLTDSVSFQNFLLKVNSLDKKSKLNLVWDNRLIKNNFSGSIDGTVDFTESGMNAAFEKMKFVVSDTLWNSNSVSNVKIDTSGQIQVENLRFTNREQQISVLGNISKQPTDELILKLDNFKLVQLNPFLVSSGTSLNGLISGNVSISDVYNKLIFAARLDFNKLEVNNKMIGSGEVNSIYDSKKESISLMGSFKKQYASGTLLDPNFKNLFFNGYYFPNREVDNIDLEIELKSLDISLLQPYVKGIITFGKGYLSGKSKITGSVNKPQINGKISLESVRNLKIDYLNTSYTASGEILLEPDRIAMEGVSLFDMNGQKAVVWGNIFHDNFKNIKLDFDIAANKFMVLNTNPLLSPSYYGKAFVTGNVGIWTQGEDINIETNVKTDKGTVFNIPLTGTEEVSENEFITFIKKDTVKSTITARNDLSHLKLTFNLEATNEADIQLIFDEKAGDVIKANGNGAIKMNINTNGNFEMFGTYTINDGSYLFTLENFINKKFDIESGSTIKWSGDPYNANINITANYKQRASLNPFFPNLSMQSAGSVTDKNSSTPTVKTGGATDDANKRYPVECKLFMRDKLLSPEITFGIALPTVTEEKRQQVMGYINNEQELNRQVFSLLLLKSFVTPLALNSQSGVNAGSAVGANATEMLSNQLSNWLSQLSSNIDVGVNYTPGSALSNEELDLALSTQLFNDRLSIDGNVGLNNNNQNKTSNVIGDVNIDYKLTDEGKLRLKAFNRSNDTYQTTAAGGQFTQGLGVFFREDFESVSELYKRYKQKLSRKK